LHRGRPPPGALAAAPGDFRIKEQTAMMKKVWLVVLVAALVSPFQASADDSLVRFDGGIGVIPVSNVTVTAEGVVTVSRNIVRGVNPAGQIWVIAGLKADIETDGRIRVEGRGLLLGGGGNIGLNANASVFATLICDATNTQHSTGVPATLPAVRTGVPLEPNGDFRIDDVLTPVPAACPSPVLLIRNAGNGGWFAAGILDLDD
jgi:hypothetical protein